ncbi:unnamed protein product [Lactuca virosa]|uniref:beta-galactosidase n=1 Tax=Lactuca virosa TaxID=75947 RepID=A0AAU9ND60_9ASTR|nr:unnamed protein product [Lactuca virosa]
MWPDLIQKEKEGGLDVIQTYVFWNGHEPQPCQYYFEDRYDLVKFIKLIKKAGLYAHLRVGCYGKIHKAFHVLYRITTNEGVLALWKGASPTVVREMALNMGMHASYDQSVEFLDHITLLTLNEFATYFLLQKCIFENPQLSTFGSEAKLEEVRNIVQQLLRWAWKHNKNLQEQAAQQEHRLQYRKGC